VLGIKHTTPVLLRLPSGKLAVIVYGGRPVNGNRWGGAAAATFIHTLLINETFTGITALQQPFQKGVVGMMHRSGAVIAAPATQGGSMLIYQGVSYYGANALQLCGSEITLTLKANVDGTLSFGQRPTTHMPSIDLRGSNSRCNAAFCQTSDLIMIFGGEICPGDNVYTRGFPRFDHVLVRPIVGEAQDWRKEPISTEFTPWCTPKMFALSQRSKTTVVVGGGYLGNPSLYANEHSCEPQGAFHFLEREETHETATWKLIYSVRVINIPTMALAYLNAAVIGDYIYSYHDYHLYLISTLEEAFMRSGDDGDEISVSAIKLVGRVPAFTQFGMMLPLSNQHILLFGGTAPYNTTNTILL
jgi:hypothetical protein